VTQEPNDGYNPSSDDRNMTVPTQNKATSQEGARKEGKNELSLTLTRRATAGSGAYEIVTIESHTGRSLGGRAVVLTSPRALAFPKKG
jgi:hypothetical protein